MLETLASLPQHLTDAFWNRRFGELIRMFRYPVIFYTPDDIYRVASATQLVAVVTVRRAALQDAGVTSLRCHLTAPMRMEGRQVVVSAECLYCGQGDRVLAETDLTFFLHRDDAGHFLIDMVDTRQLAVTPVDTTPEIEVLRIG